MAKSAKSAQMQMKMHSTTFPAHQHAHTEIGQYAKCVCKLCFGQQFQYFMRPTWRMSNVSGWQKMLCGQPNRWIIYIIYRKLFSIQFTPLKYVGVFRETTY